jgi:hypothetical protein
MQQNTTTYYLLLHTKWPFFREINFTRKLVFLLKKDRDHLLKIHKQNRSSDPALEGIIIIRPDSFPFPVRWHNTKNYYRFHKKKKRIGFLFLFSEAFQNNNGFNSCVTKKVLRKKNIFFKTQLITSKATIFCWKKIGFSFYYFEFLKILCQTE